MAQIDPAQFKQTCRVVWIALLASQVIYVAVTLSGIARTRDEPLDLLVLPIALAVVAVATAIGSHLCWRRAAGAGRPIHMSPPEPATALPLYMIAWVLDESISVYGLVLGLMAFSTEMWTPFSAAALVLTLIHRPS